MKKNYFVALLALFVNLATAQFAPTTYRGAFAPSVDQWTKDWTEFNPINATYGDVTTPITSNITTNTTWTNDKVYELKGTIFVKNNATLTIQAGTVIRSNTNAAALIVTRGSKLNAIGTASQPIVFTSKNAAGSRGRGNWGGIVILGKGRYNINNGEQYIEGITQSNDTQFGGGLSPINNDNSGTLQYVRIEFAGYVFAVDNELNGLTMGGVGSGTTIDHIQVSYSNDDSFEWFGGSVNCSYLVAMNGLDDDFDTDNGFNGNVQFGLSLKDPQGFDISTSECFESDNANPGTPVGNATTDAWKTSAIFSNFTCLGPAYRVTLTTPTVTSVNNLHDKAVRIRRESQLKIFNSLFLDFRRGLSLENGSVGNFTTSPFKTKFQNNIIAGGTPLIVTTSGIDTKYAENNTSLAATTSTTAATGTSLILVNPYPAKSENTTPPGYTGLDYRPGTDSPALSGASFTDAAFTGLLNVNTTELPIVAQSSFTYCKGDVATQLSAVTNSSATAVTWYNVTGTEAVPVYTAISGAPTPLTTTAGIKKYAVTQTLNGVVSNKVTITVTTLAPTTTVLGNITNADGGAAITNITSYVGVGTATTNVTYKTTVTLGTGETLVWLVPDGASIASGQGTATVTVKFTNAPAGAAPYGNISVQVIGANGCPGTPKTLALTATLPTAPAFKMFNIPATGTTPVSVTGFAQYMGTNTTLNLKVDPAAAGATSYVWELPTNVNPVLGTVSSTTVRYYLIYPFLVPLTAIPTTLSTGSTTNVGKKYYEVTDTLYSSGITKTTVRLLRVATYVASPLSQTTESLGDITTTINEVAISPVYPIISTTGTTLPINFTNLTPADTHAYNTTAATPVATNVIRIGVKSRNGVGLSTTSNATLVNPTTTSTASLLTLTSTAPAAPATLVLTNPALLGTAATTAITNVSKFIGSTTTFKLTAAASVLAHSYSWELPNGVNRTDANGGSVEGLTSTDPFIYVNFANVASGTTSIVFGVKAVNGVGSSSSVNVAPNADRTAKLLTVASPVPAAPATLTLTNGVTATAVTVVSKFIRKTTTFKLIAAASVLANSYSWELPLGVNRTDADGVSIDELTSTDPFIYVNFADVPPGITSIVFGVKAVNGVGSSSSVNVAPNTDRTAKLLTVTATVPAAPATLVLTNPALFGTAATTAVTNISKFIGTTTTFKLTATASVLANTYSWELPSGVNRTDLDGGYVEGFTSLDPFIYVNFANVLPGTTVTRIGVLAVNGVGFSSTNNSALINPTTFSTAKLLTLTSTVPAAPATFIMTNDAVSTTAAVTIISKFIGTATEFTLRATASVLANSYSWEIPDGVNVVAGSDVTSNSIKVNFADVAQGTTVTRIGVKAVNGVGSSSTSNSALLNPTTTSTAKLLTLTSTVPAAPATLVLTNPALLGTAATTAITSVSKFIGTTTTFKLTAAASVLANGYVWQLPDGVNRTDADGVSIDYSDSTDPFIFVNFADALPTASYVFRVLAGNGVGNSSFKTLTVTAGVPSAVTTVSGLTSVCSRSEGYEYTITAPAGATTYTITAPVGSMVTSPNGANIGSSNILATTDLTFKVVYTGGTAAFSTTDKTLRIVSGNVFGPATVAKALTLTKVTCPLGKVDMASPVMVSEVSIYPNPATDNFNLELTTSVASEMSMTIYSMNGATVRTKNIQLSEGNNVINEDISSLANGIYFVRFNNPTNNETIVRKLIKI